MSTLEDKILGDKLQYYCSSSEDEGNDGDSDDEKFEDCEGSSNMPQAAAEPEVPNYSEMTHWSGNAANTGPKGESHLKFTA